MYASASTEHHSEGAARHMRAICVVAWLLKFRSFSQSIQEANIDVCCSVGRQFSKVMDEGNCGQDACHRYFRPCRSPLSGRHRADESAYLAALDAAYSASCKPLTAPPPSQAQRRRRPRTHLPCRRAVTVRCDSRHRRRRVSSAGMHGCPSPPVSPAGSRAAPARRRQSRGRGHSRDCALRRRSACGVARCRSAKHEYGRGRAATAGPAHGRVVGGLGTPARVIDVSCHRLFTCVIHPPPLLPF